MVLINNLLQYIVDFTTGKNLVKAKMDNFFQVGNYAGELLDCISEYFRNVPQVLLFTAETQSAQKC
jgi:hypothetical protein